MEKGPHPASYYNDGDYERAVVNSTLWAAVGDALGWTTELSRGYEGVRHRTGKKRVSAPVEWQRLIGGRGGVKVKLPAGTYSDDTQLRLCVSRSIRGNGSFDVETFAKIEVTAWQGYALGAGIGSKAAAANLSKRGTNWFSNFFRTQQQSYTTAGGNGAAMRIQPHVWSAKSSQSEMLAQALRNSIVTHGHPHGFLGALFHALCLWDALVSRSVPNMRRARDYISSFEQLPALIDRDAELSQFWLPSWERETNQTLEVALAKFRNDALSDIKIAEQIIESGDVDRYFILLERIGCLSDKFRGSGFKTALAALALASIYGDFKIEEALVASANELNSDTDTIATMAGALLGAITERPPTWDIQDRAYLEEEAKRLARIARGRDQATFVYPDVSSWDPPNSQSDAVVHYGDGLALVGLGPLLPRSIEYRSGNSIWQWFELPFGQTILAKRRVDGATQVDSDQMPGPSQSTSRTSRKSSGEVGQDSFYFERVEDPQRDRSTIQSSANSKDGPIGFPGIDQATDIIISSGFDDAILGRFIKQCIDATGSIELAASLSAIIAKARLARARRK